jgi:transmembrane sensor
MIEASPEEDRLFEEALDLVIRLQNDPGNPVPLDMVQRWRARSTKHEKAWAEVAEIHGMTGKILMGRRRAARRTELGLTRRNLVIGGTIGLGAMAAGTLYGPGLLLKARADVLTATAEVRRVSLPDGSVATLGPDSAIAIGFDAEARRIDLLAGMAFFDVAPEPKRPFRVKTDRLTSTALGTAFDISNDAGFLTVAVDHGVVEVQTSASALSSGERLSAGQWLTLAQDTMAVERGFREPDQIATWRDGMIVADREAISVVVAKIARWQPGRTLIADPFFGSQRVSGVFDLHNPVRALEAVVQPYGGKVRRIPPYLTVISPL